MLRRIDLGNPGVVPFKVQRRWRDATVQVLERRQAPGRLVVARPAHPVRRRLERGAFAIGTNAAAQGPPGRLLLTANNLLGFPIPCLGTGSPW